MQSWPLWARVIKARRAYFPVLLCQAASSPSFESGAMRDEGRRGEESASGRVIPTLAQIKNCNLRYLRGAASLSREGTFSDRNCGRCRAFPDPAIFFSVIWLRFAPWESFQVETRRDLKICEIEWIHEKDINLKFHVFSRSSQKSQRESRTSQIYLIN